MADERPVDGTSRRQFLKRAAGFGALSLLAACGAPQAPSGGQAGATAAPAADGATSAPAATATNWLTADDISDMPPTTIRYWFYETPERTALGKRQVSTFQKIFPNITVEGRTAPESVDNEQLLAFIKTGTNSHVHQSVNLEDLWYINRDLLLPLEELPGFQEVWDRLAPANNYTWKDGHVYSMSWYGGPMTMFYNKQHVTEAGLNPDAPPTTYSEFLTWAKALTVDKNGDGRPEQWFTRFTIGEEWWWYQFIFYPFYIGATGTNQLIDTEGTRAIFNTPEALKAYQLFDQLYGEGYALNEAMEGNPFISGITSASLSSPSLFGTIRNSAPQGFEYIVGPVPKPDDATHEGNPTYNFVRNFALMREQGVQGEEADRINRASWEFMKFLLSPEELAADFSVSGDFPAVKDLTENPLYVENLDRLGAQGRWVAEYTKQGQIYDLNTVYASEGMAVLQNSWKNVALRSATPEESLSAAEQQVNDLLAKGAA